MNRTHYVCKYCDHKWSKPLAKWLNDDDFCEKCKDKNITKKVIESVDYYGEELKKEKK